MAFIPQPQSSDDYRANAREARAVVAQQLGISLPPAGADVVRLFDETAAFIEANRKLFSATQVDSAIRAMGRHDFRTPLADDSIDAADFVRAYGETFGETVEGAAGIVGRSASKLLGFNLGTLVIVLGGAAILYFGAPYVIPKLRAAFAKK